jgi:predicted LPLAT superfamily acyltransferase
MNFKLCFVIPIYNHKDTIVQIVDKLQQYQAPIFIIDDGSDRATQSQLNDIVSKISLVNLIRFERNQGKGAAVMRGLKEAFVAGFTHALQIDADGQHDTQDVRKFLIEAKKSPQALIVGQPIFDASISKTRYYARFITHIWVALETLTLNPLDAMCGFRVYPLKETVSLFNKIRFSPRMAFDIEIIVRLYWTGVTIVRLSTQVIYPEKNISNFDLIKDNYHISKTHAKLFLGMLLRIPYLIKRKYREQNKHWSLLQERGSYWGIKFTVATYLLLGYRAFNFFLYFLIAYFYLTNAKTRQDSQAYLNRIKTINPNHPLWSKTNYPSFYHYMEFAHAIMDKILAWTGYITHRDVDFPNREEFMSLLEAKQGAVFIGSHLGNLELTRALADAEYDARITAIVFTEHAQNFNRVLQELNPRVAINLLEIKEMQLDAIVSLKEKVASGEYIVIVGDRTSYANPERVCYANFLGEPAPFPQGPFIVASLMRCPVYLLFCLKEQGRYTLYFELFAHSLDLPSQNKQAILQHYVERYAQRLEFYCLKSPLQWFNFFDFWQKK